MRSHVFGAGGGYRRRGAGASAIEALGEPGFPDAFLAATAEALDVDLCSAFRLDRAGKMHLLFAAGWTPGSSDFARAASTVYAETHWRADPIMAPLPGPATMPAVVCQRWDKIADERYRHVCYEAPGVVERVSVQGRTATDLIQVGLYRTRGSGFFTPADLRRVGRIGDVLLALVAKHRAMMASKPSQCLSPDRAAVARQLALAFSGLSPREAEICGALLCGNTAKEIAALVGIEPSSVMTYRKRAFLKLGVTTSRDLLRRYRDACHSP